MEQQKQITEDVTQYLKLMKMSKGYNWEIKVNVLDVEKIKQLNQRMMESFGSLE
jgi:ssRNA-specific RNase YbeY (16S rRNA maturation enzyme)